MMTFATVATRALYGIRAQPVTVEAHLANGLSNFTIVGLPETAVRESRDRVKSALAACQFEFPIKRITVNLAPADLPKQGSHFDLAIALSILAAAGHIPKATLVEHEFIGELSLMGELRLTQNMLALALATDRPDKTLILPHLDNQDALVSNTPLKLASHLGDVIAYLLKKTTLTTVTPTLPAENALPLKELAQIKGQVHAKHALMIAASGGHSLLMSGPPGTGKTLLASHLPSLLPPLNRQEALQSAVLRLLHHDDFNLAQFWTRPFRSPHHSASPVALVGGGNPPRPGEISLAHHGVLFLDELPEFSRAAINALRQPLEAGNITIARAAHSVDFPAQFQLVSAMNPCPCGYHNDPERACRCTPSQIQAYLAKISGPICDRIDMLIHVPRIPLHLLHKQAEAASVDTLSLRKKVLAARAIQLDRQAKTNSQLQHEELQTHIHLSEAAQQTLQTAAKKLKLSIRAYQRIMKVSRTIADLNAEKTVSKNRILEALSYRLES